jgi:hypothetical protein
MALRVERGGKQSVEGAINKLKRLRCIATRYDRNPQCLLAMLCLAAVVTFWA